MPYFKFCLVQYDEDLDILSIKYLVLLRQYYVVQLSSTAYHKASLLIPCLRQLHGRCRIMEPSTNTSTSGNRQVYVDTVTYLLLLSEKELPVFMGVT